MIGTARGEGGLAEMSKMAKRFLLMKGLLFTNRWSPWRNPWEGTRAWQSCHIWWRMPQLRLLQIIKHLENTDVNFIIAMFIASIQVMNDLGKRTHCLWHHQQPDKGKYDEDVWGRGFSTTFENCRVELHWWCCSHLEWQSGAGEWR